MTKNVNTVPWPPFKRSGTTISPRTTGDVLRLSDGAVGTPAYSFVNDINSGFYSIGADNIGLALNGFKLLDFTATGATFSKLGTATEEVGTQTYNSTDIISESSAWDTDNLIAETWKFKWRITPTAGPSTSSIYRLYCQKDGGSESSVFTVSNGGAATATSLYISGASGISSNLVNAYSSTFLSLKGKSPDSGSAVGVVLDNTVDLTAGAKILSIRNNAVEKAYVAHDGSLALNKLGTATAGTTTYNSPYVLLQSSAWDTDEVPAIPRDLQWKITNVASSSATPVGNLVFSRSTDAGAYTDIATLFSNGNLTITGAYQGYGWFYATTTSGVSARLRGNVTASGTAIANQFGNVSGLTTAGDKIASFYSDAFVTEKAYVDKDGGLTTQGSIVGKQGTSIASASTIAITKTGNVFELTGTTAVNLITTTGYQDGFEITLIANGNVTINHGATTSGANVTIKLAGQDHFAMSANSTLKLVLSTTTAGGQAWREISRTTI